MIRGNTFCYRLWGTVFIDLEGEVYSCCHYRPASFGNINRQTLQDIWNSKKLQYFRKLSLVGALSCFKSCELFLDPKITPNGKIPKGISLWRADYSCLYHIGFNYSNRCNIRCIMCYQDHDRETSLSLENIIKNINFNYVKRVSIQGGEPLLIEGAKELFDYLAKRGIRVDFLTNGTLITDEWASKIALHSKIVYISLNAATKKTHEKINVGSQWERVLGNIERIRYYKRKYNSDIIIGGHMTIVKENLHEIPLFIRHYKEFGFDRIEFGFDSDSVPFFLARYPILKEKLKKLINSALLEQKMEEDMRGNVYVLKLLGLMDA